MTTTAAAKAEGARHWLRHLLCIAALMWTALVNGAPFFFPDTTSYVRAADLVAYKISDGRVRTAWTDRYARDLREGDTLRAHGVTAPPSSRSVGNDVRAGNIMSGRSPYIGALLWLGYVTSDFWLFVLLQAAVCYGLLLLALRRFGLDRPAIVGAVVALLAIGTALPYFNALLLADALAAFGIVAFLLLLTDRGTLRPREAAFAWTVLAMSLVSHLTHIVMLLAMMALAALLAWRGALPWPRRGRLAAFAALLVAALGSILLTSLVVAHVFQRKPQLVPLMTARFIADGPGARFIREGCGGRDFAVCKLKLPPGPIDATLFLWATAPPAAVFLTASPAQRARMSAEDTRFALAVLRAHPIEQAAMIVFNTARQLVSFRAEGYDQRCMADAACSPALPEAVRAEVRGSLGGHGLWPRALLTPIYFTVVIGALAVIAVSARAALRAEPVRARALMVWIAMVAVAMLTNAVFGGAVSEPQYRYQGRLVWLVPLLAAITFGLARGQARRETA